MSSKEKMQKHRKNLSELDKKRQQEAAKMGMRKLRGKKVDNITNDNMDMSAPVEVQVPAGPGEMDQDLAEGLQNADQPVMEEAFVCDEEGFEEDHDGGIEMEEVQVHSEPLEVEPDQDGGLKMKRFDVLVSTMISNYFAGVISGLHAAQHQ